MIPNELSRPVRVDTIGDQPRVLEIVADARERAALARRFGLLALDRLEARIGLISAGPDIAASGRIRADAVQACIVTGDPVRAHIDEPIAILFRPEPASASADEEGELDEGELDVMFYDGASIDAGEAVAQTLGLALDPYPRSESAGDASVIEESEAGPFAGLAGLRDKLTK